MSLSISHHPDDATLMAYAAATLAEPLAAVVAAHVSLCPRCRAETADLERLGAALMLGSPRRSGEAPLEARHRAVDPLPALARPRVSRDERLPAPIAAAYQLSMEQIPWRRLGPGVWHHRLALREADEGDLRLLRLGAGRTMPDHGHGGAEITLVLEGSYSDVTGEYRGGDVQDVDEDIEHQPIVGKDRDCICLIASVQPARFKSLIGRITQPWTRL